MQKPLRKGRRALALTASLLRPAKLLRTLFYHSYVYRIRRAEHAGLHLGAGGLRIPGFLNIDANAFIDCDVVAGLDNLKLGTRSVDVIYASHVFEHFPKAKVKACLTEWFRVLRRGGHLYLCVPDLEALAKIYLENLPGYDDDEVRATVDRACDVMYGGQSNKYDFHYYGYSFTTMKALAYSVGFSRVELFDRKTLSFAPLHDAGLAVIKDIPISLNIRATK